jgi:DNA modification methylase
MKYLGGHLYEGDCLTVLKQVADQSVHMVMCDLPYGTTQNKWDIFTGYFYSASNIKQRTLVPV